MKRRFFHSLIASLLLLPSAFFTSASTKTAYECACLLSTSCAIAFQSTQALLEQAERSSSPSIVELGRVISESLRFADESVAHYNREALRWELGQALLNLHDLISLQAENFSAQEIEGVAKGYLKQTQDSISRYTAQPFSSQQGSGTPVLAGAEYFPLPEVETPQMRIFVAQSTEGFSKWVRKRGRDERKAIEKRLVGVSSTGHFGDVEVTQSRNHKSNATIYEMRFYLGAGPRIYYLQMNNSVVILAFSLKSDGKTAQDRAVRRAGEIADAFLALQRP